MTSVPSIDSIIESFPNPELPKIEGKPTHDDMANLRTLLAANAASIPSLRGGGGHGYLGIVLSPAVYTTVSATAWNNPNFPGAVPVIAPNATAAATGEAVRQHTERLREWKEYTHVEAALKKQLINAIEPIYLRAIRDGHVGFDQHKVSDILQHLMSSCGNITAMDLETNSKTMKEPWQPFD